MSLYTFAMLPLTICLFLCTSFMFILASYFLMFLYSFNPSSCRPQRLQVDLLLFMVVYLLTNSILSFTFMSMKISSLRKSFKFFSIDMVIDNSSSIFFMWQVSTTFVWSNIIDLDMGFDRSQNLLSFNFLWENIFIVILNLDCFLLFIHDGDLVISSHLLR